MKVGSVKVMENETYISFGIGLCTKTPDCWSLNQHSLRLGKDYESNPKIKSFHQIHFPLSSIEVQSNKLQSNQPQNFAAVKSKLLT